MKKFASSILVVLMLCTVIPLLAIPAAADDEPVTEYYCLDVGAGAYIDTKYVPKVNTRVVMDCAVNNQWAALFGTIYFGYGHYYHYYVNSDGTKFGSGFSQSQSWADEALVQTGRHTIELDKNVFKYGDTKQTEHNGSELLSWGTPMYLFGIHLDDQTQTFENQRIHFYSCQIYEGDDLVRDFVPARQGDCFGVYDKQNKEFYKKQGGGYVAAYKEAAQDSDLPGGSDGVILDFDGTVNVSGNTVINALPAQSAILVADGRKVTINIEKNATLTVTGGKAHDEEGAGAGIEVPESAMLTITGKGNLVATGGIAAGGGVGEKGEDAKIVSDDPDHNKKDWIYTGAGGRGGNGGGGAGAGIGGRGGNGGFGGAGGAGLSVEAWSDHNGNNGSNGQNGTAGGKCGSVTICKTVGKTVNGGAASGTPAWSGWYGDSAWHKWTNTYHAGGGGGGGTGGSGYAGADIGSGGAGAGGGGGGGSGLVVYWGKAYSVNGNGHGGLGGIGSSSGLAGHDLGSEQNTSKYRAGAGGGGGNSGGGAGAPTSVRYPEPLYLPVVHNSLTYNGTEQDGVGLSNYSMSRVTIEGHKATEVGNYTATVTPRDGYCWEDGTIGTKTYDWKIEKATVAVPKLSFCYTGKEISVASDGRYTLEGGKATNVGDYPVKLTLNYPAGYKWENSENATVETTFNIHEYADNNGKCLHCGGTEHYCFDLPYLDRTVNGSSVVTVQMKCDVAKGITEGDSEWGVSGKDTWYVVDRNIVLDKRPVVEGNVCIILMNDKTLKANMGITVEGENTSLSFYAQTDEAGRMGKLEAVVTNGTTAIGGRNGGDGADGYSASNKSDPNGTSGNQGFNCGSVLLFGGEITLESQNAVCIGGGNGGKGGSGARDCGSAGNGGKGGKGGDGCNVAVYAGIISLKSSNAVCIGGGNGGKGGKGGDGGLYNGMLSDCGWGGCGGAGGNVGKVQIYGGCTLLTNTTNTASAACIGGGTGGQGGSHGKDALKGVSTGSGDNGDPGAFKQGDLTVYGSPVMKVGESEQKAELIDSVEKYTGQQYFSVIYQNADIGSVLSQGVAWIIIGVAVAATGTVAALVIVKKKKKPVPADGEGNKEI